ncbi:MAG TPA: hypothetical protein VMB73_04840 [Acetobacteraceae bacterium]|nr:hypothetical protein [Acetobacteraceae bacterium]
MEWHRTTETTLVGDDLSASFLFIPMDPRPGGIFVHSGSVPMELGITPYVWLSEWITAWRQDEEKIVNLILGFLSYGVNVPNLKSLYGEWSHPSLEEVIIQHLESAGAYTRSKHAGIESIETRQQIVIERSPPQFVSFLEIVKLGSGASIGALTGYLAGEADPPLLLITVPFGIVICATAMGLGVALEQGLKKRVFDWLDKRN